MLEVEDMGGGGVRFKEIVILKYVGKQKIFIFFNL